MLNVKTPDEVLEVIDTHFKTLEDHERVSISEALGRTLFADVCSSEFVPGFDRSSVDGFAIHAKDSFGCTESIPALLKISL